MSALLPRRPAEFCWLDLAASDAALARRFYAQAFGWTFHDRHANGGRFTLCRAGERDVASLYPLRQAQLELGVPSHWTPYLGVGSADISARQVVEAGGRVVVAPFDVRGTARIALVEDAVGALLGLWQALPGARSDAP
ncbi:MAG TPA: VOC family protein [Rhizobacter sp.]|nr:VOC family protein [Rhizobacter sp.]